MMALMFWLGVVGVVLDWRYIRRGGLGPTGAEKRGLLMAVAIVVVAIAGLAILGSRAEGLGGLSAFFTSVVVAIWSGNRYRIRRAHPVIVRRS